MVTDGGGIAKECVGCFESRDVTETTVQKVAKAVALKLADTEHLGYPYIEKCNSTLNGLEKAESQVRRLILPRQGYIACITVCVYNFIRYNYTINVLKFPCFCST